MQESKLDVKKSLGLNLRRLTGVVGHRRPGHIHGVERNDGSLEQARMRLHFLEQTAHLLDCSDITILLTMG